MIKKTISNNSLDSLFDNYNSSNITARDESGNLNKGVVELKLDSVITNPDQPRKHFDEQSLNELSESIRTFGVIQPIIVVKKRNKYVIVAGERRYRASLIAGLEVIPAIIKNFTDKECKEIALIENIQRENLNAIEEAMALKALLDEYKISQETLATRLGKSRPVIANTVRLLTLDEEVQKLIACGRLSAGHGRCLVAIKDNEIQKRYAKASCDKNISVRELEKMVNAYLNPNKEIIKKPIRISDELKELVSDMQRIFSTKVKAVGTEDKGRIYIDYFTKDDLNRIYSLMESLKK